MCHIFFMHPSFVVKFMFFFFYFLCVGNTATINIVVCVFPSIIFSSSLCPGVKLVDHMATQ